MTLQPILLFEATLDLCPSINRAYLTTRDGRRILTEEARNWKSEWKYIMASKKYGYPIKFPINYAVRVERHFIFANNHRRDYNNYIKILDDALVNSGILSDDCTRIIAADSNTHEINSDIGKHLVRIRVFSF